jgi:hypothetical protein
MIKSMAQLPYLDLGIAMCHFELTAKEQSLSGEWLKNNPNFSSQPSDFEYIVTWVSK